MSGLPSGAFWNSFVTVTINSKVNNDLVLWNNPTSKWVNLSSITIYKKITVPICCCENSGSIVTPTLSLTYGNMYPLITSALQYIYLNAFSMPYDYVEGSAITLILHLYFPTAPSGNSLTIAWNRSSYYNGGFQNGSNNTQNYTISVTSNYDFIMPNVSMSSVLTNYNNIFYFNCPLSGYTYSGTVDVISVDIVYQSNCYGSSSTTSKT